MLSKSNRNGITEPQATSTLVETREVSVGKSARDEETEMRAMRAEKFSGYDGLKLVNLPRPAVSDGKVLLRMTAAGVTPLEHTILSGHHARSLAA